MPASPTLSIAQKARLVANLTDEKFDNCVGLICISMLTNVAIIGQMSKQVSLGSAGDYEADEQAGVSRLSWRLSSR